MMEHKRNNLKNNLLIIALTVCAFAAIIICGIGLTACYRQEEPYVTFETVEALRAASVGGEGDEEIKLGGTVRTRGYHSANDGGGGLYEIVSGEELADNGGTVIKLADGHFAKLKFGAENSVNIMQFGAKGDGKANDLPAFQAAMSAETGASVVVFPEGKEFVMGRNFMIQRNDLEIRGNNSTLVINDNSYSTLSNFSHEFFIYIYQSQNLTIDGLNVSSVHIKGIGINPTTREPDSARNYATQLCVSSSTGIDILNCKFTAVTKPNIGGFNNIDLRKDWHDVEIKGCRLESTADAELGVCLMARDLELYDTTDNYSDTLLVEDNYFYKITHDEILWIGGQNARVSNVTVRNNEFKMVKGELSTLTPHAISVVGDGTSAENFGYAKDIIIEDNRFDFVGSISCFNFGGNLTNVHVRRNTGTWTASAHNAQTIPNVVVCQNNQNPGVKTNVVLEENTITVKADYDINHITFANCTAALINNNIKIECNVKDLFGAAVLEAKDNTVEIDGNITESVSASCRSVIDNTVTATGYIQRCLEVMISVMTVNIVFEDNRIEAGSARQDLGAESYTNFLIISGTEMRGYKVQMANNTVTAPEPIPGNPQNVVYYINIKDTEMQYVNIAPDNNLPAHYSRKYRGGASGPVTVTNNPE